MCGYTYTLDAMGGGNASSMAISSIFVLANRKSAAVKGVLFFRFSLQEVMQKTSTIVNNENSFRERIRKDSFANVPK